MAEVATIRAQRATDSETLGPARWDLVARHEGSSMEKWLCLLSMAIAGIVLVAFVLDLVLKFPFGGLSLTVDIVAILAAGLIGYLGWESYREQR
jgi:hypothetical protein